VFLLREMRGVADDLAIDFGTWLVRKAFWIG